MLSKTVLGFRKSRMTHCCRESPPGRVAHRAWRVLEARTQPCGSGGGWKVQRPREAAEARLPLVRTEAAARERAADAPLAAALQGPNLTGCGPQFSSKSTCWFWPDGDLLGGGLRRLLS